MATTDQALQVLRIHDVGTAHTPLVGAPSRFGWSHPGPLQFWALAPFFRLFGSGGVLVGTALINLAALSAALWAAFRLGGRTLTLLVTVAAAILIHALTISFLLDPWNPWVAVLPFLAYLLGLNALLVDRSLALLPIVVATGTFAVQAHVSYVPLVGALALLALTLGLVRNLPGWHRRHRHPRPRPAPARHRRPILVAVAVLALLWLPPLIQQFTGHPGNLSALVSYFEHSKQPAAGWTAAVGVMARQLAPVGPWLSGHETNSLGILATAGAGPALLVLLAVALLGMLAWWRKEHRPATLCFTILFTDLIGTAATARVTGVLGGYLVRWWWVLAALTFVAGAWAALAILAPWLSSIRPQLATTGLGIAVAVGILAALGSGPARPPNQVASRTAGALVDQLAHRIDRRRAYVVVSIDSLHLGAVATGVTVQMLMDGYRTYGVPEQAEAMGAWRTRQPGDTDGVIYIVDGEEVRHGWSPPRGAGVVARFDPLTPAERQNATAAEARVVAALGPRAPHGPVTVDTPYERELLVAEGARPKDVELLEEARARGDDFIIYLAPAP